MHKHVIVVTVGFLGAAMFAADADAMYQPGVQENGYLLRCWLTVQEIEGVKAKVIDP